MLNKRAQLAIEISKHIAPAIELGMGNFPGKV
jgi:hypothetical protein